MNSFKEWLSDYLRYFILLLAMILAIGVIILGVQLYKSSQSAREAQADPDNIVILDESENMQTETETDTSEETEETETEIETAKETEPETHKGVNAKPETDSTDKEERSTETSGQETASGSGETRTSEGSSAGGRQNTFGTSDEEIIVLTEAQRDSGSVPTASQTETPRTETSQTEAPHTEPPQTEPPTEVYEPVYLTMTGTCYFRSYADYGDNIIGEYPAGTVVEFLEDVGGWYKVQVDGMVGYMGAKFFQ